MTALEKKQFDLRVLKKCRVSFASCLVMVLSLVVLKLVFANRAATWGRQVETIVEETAAVKAENDQLKLELARQNGGLEQLKAAALEQGFVEQPQYLYLTSGETVAQKRP